MDAYAAARAALAGHGVAVPKDANTGALRALVSARRSAVKAHTAAINQIHALLVSPPAELRERYRRHHTIALVKALARGRPATHGDPTTAAVLTAAKALAQRAEFLEHQKQDLTAQPDDLVRQTNPALRATYGIGADTAAQLLVTAGTNPHRLRNEASFAALCGAAPVPASSGKITDHRLSRGCGRSAVCTHRGRFLGTAGSLSGRSGRFIYQTIFSHGGRSNPRMVYRLYCYKGITCQR